MSTFVATLRTDRDTCASIAPDREDPGRVRRGCDRGERLPGRRLDPDDRTGGDDVQALTVVADGDGVHGAVGQVTGSQREVAGENDEDAVLYTRLVNIMSHGAYSLYEPQEMLEENKRYFRKILNDFIAHYPFNPSLFASVAAQAMTPPPAAAPTI